MTTERRRRNRPDNGRTSASFGIFCPGPPYNKPDDFTTGNVWLYPEATTVPRARKIRIDRQVRKAAHRWRESFVAVRIPNVTGTAGQTVR